MAQIEATAADPDGSGGPSEGLGPVLVFLRDARAELIGFKA
jgi:hypothetical protein